MVTQNEISRLGVKCDYLIYDFGGLGNVSEAENLLSSIDSALSGKDVAILINNVAEFQHEEFANASLGTIFRATNVNCHAQAILSNHFLKKLISRPVKSALVSFFPDHLLIFPNLSWSLCAFFSDKNFPSTESCISWVVHNITGSV